MRNDMTTAATTSGGCHGAGSLNAVGAALSLLMGAVFLFALLGGRSRPAARRSS